MTDSDIQNSRHLLKRLDEEMIFLRDIMSQVNHLTSQVDSLSTQVTFVTSGLKETWNSIEKIHNIWNKGTKKQ